MDNFSLLIIFIYIIKVGVAGQECEPVMPYQAVNVTVVEGDTAILPCVVENVCNHMVVWIDTWNTLLTFDDRRIIDDPRISIERPNVEDWNLKIRDTTLTDQMEYTCAVNTDPIKTIKVMLKVGPRS